MKKKPRILIPFKKNNGFYLSLFFIFFITALLISLVIKGINLYKEAEFTGESIMVLVVLSDDSYVIRLDRGTEQLSVLRIDEVQIESDNLTLASIRTGVPLHGAILVKGEQNDIDSVVTAGGMLQLLMGNNVQLIQMNELDAFAFAYAAQKIPIDKKTVKVIENYVYDRSIISQIDHELYELFRDPEVINERTSIEVVNATTTSGIATAVAQMLENGGYNVVAIRSADIQESVIQTNMVDTVTAEHVKKIFAFPVASPGSNAVADIRIVVGEDTIQ